MEKLVSLCRLHSYLLHCSSGIIQDFYKLSMLRASKMAQLVKALVTKSDDLSLVPGITR